jgi:hypothetical protein
LSGAQKGFLPSPIVGDGDTDPPWRKLSNPRALAGFQNPPTSRDRNAIEVAPVMKTHDAVRIRFVMLLKGHDALHKLRSTLIGRNPASSQVSEIAKFS